MWLSGLRLTESFVLHWDRGDGLRVELGGRRPMLAIPAECEKGNRGRMLPITPDFAEFLLKTPDAERRGSIFRPLLLSAFEPHAAEEILDTLVEMAAEVHQAN